MDILGLGVGWIIQPQLELNKLKKYAVTPKETIRTTMSYILNGTLQIPEAVYFLFILWFG